MGRPGAAIEVSSLYAEGQRALAWDVQLVVRVWGLCGIWFWGQHVSVG